METDGTAERYKYLCDELTRYLCYLHGQLRRLGLLDKDGRLAGLKLDDRVLDWFRRHDAWDRHRVAMRLGEFSRDHDLNDFVSEFIRDAEAVQPLSEWHRGVWIREVISDFIGLKTEKPTVN